jgi:hypothetical protein
MELRKVDAVEREMGRLMDAIKALRIAHTETGVRVAGMPKDQHCYFNPKNASEPKHTGAVKRASMDLTRA